MARIVALDAYRGLLITLMFFDHAVGIVVDASFVEFWVVHYMFPVSDVFAYVRGFAHFVAPGFFMLMGISMMLFTKKHIRNGLSYLAVYRFFARRGLMLIGLQFMLINLAWYCKHAGFSLESVGMYYVQFFTGTLSSYYFGVLWALGMSLLLCGACVHVHKRRLYLLGLSIFALTFCWKGILAYEIGISSLLVRPFVTAYVWSGMTVFYPVLPWIGFVFIGMGIGASLIQHGSLVFKKLMTVGVGALVLALLLRFFMIGNAPYNEWDSVTTFFQFTKYTPSLIFVLYALGINFILLWLFERFRIYMYVPIGMFLPRLGRHALLLYMLHLFILLSVAPLLTKCTSVGAVLSAWGILLLLCVGIVTVLDLCKQKNECKTCDDT